MNNNKEYSEALLKAWELATYAKIMLAVGIYTLKA